MWKRWVFIIICLGLVVARLFIPCLSVDIISVWLIVIACVLFFLPQVGKILPFITKMKIGGAEIEFGDELKGVGTQLDQIIENAPSRPISVVDAKLGDEVEEIINTAKTNPQAALLLLSARLERSIRNRLLEQNLISEDKYLNLLSMMHMGGQNNLFPKSYVDVVLDFWKLRNRVAHGHDIDVSNAKLLSLITMGTEILRLVSLKE